MAARIARRYDDQIRARIQVGNIISRLQKHVDGVEDMSETRIKAAQILLRKALPDLAAIEHSGPDNGPLKVEFSWRSKPKPEK